MAEKKVERPKNISPAFILSRLIYHLVAADDRAKAKEAERAQRLRAGPPAPLHASPSPDLLAAQATLAERKARIELGRVRIEIAKHDLEIVRMEREEEELLATLAAERAELARLKVENRANFEVPPLRLVHTAAGETAETEKPTELERVEQQIRDADREAEKVEQELRDAALATAQARSEQGRAPEQDGSDPTPTETPTALDHIVEVPTEGLSHDLVDRLDDAHQLLEAGDYRGALAGFQRLVQEFRPYYATGCVAAGHNLVHVLRCVGELHLQLEDPASALRNTGEALQIIGDLYQGTRLHDCFSPMIEVSCLYATCLYVSGDRESALDTLLHARDFIAKETGGASMPPEIGELDALTEAARTGRWTSLHGDPQHTVRTMP
ncbi:MAG: hypothetical protein IPK80_28475 [Nannocystis sp.]|nr:hypothetical protein [Nannocystis sp.]